MDALFWLLLTVLVLELTVGGGLFALTCVRHARTGRALDFLRPRCAVVDVEQPAHAAGELCREILRHVPDGLRLRFSLHQLSRDRTRIAVSGAPARFRALSYAFTRQRMTLIERYAARLAEHGGGHVVEMRFGNAS